MNQPSNESQEYGLSFGGLLLMLWDVFLYLCSKWKWLFLFAILGAVIGFFFAKNSTTKYQTKLTFMVNEQDGGTSGVESLLGNLGLDRPGSSQHNLPKILDLSRSMHIIRKVLLDRTTIDGQEDYFANHFIRQYHLHQQWKGSTDLEGFLFKENDFNRFDSNAKKVLKILHSKIVGSETMDGIFTNSLSNDSQIMTLSITSPSEDLSVNLLLAIYEALSTYYVEKSTEKQQATFKSIQAETDSIQQKLKSAEYRLAKFQDTRQNLVQQRAQIERNRLFREVTVGYYLGNLYGSAKSASKFNLKQKTDLQHRAENLIYTRF